MNNQNGFLLSRIIFALILSSAFFFTEAPSNGEAKQASASVDTTISEPSELIRLAIEDIFRVLRENEKLYQQDPQKLRQIVGNSALPYLYVARMAQLSVGKNWKNASNEQRDVIIREFQTYLIRSYTNTLYNYRYTKPEMLGREDNGPNKTNLKVRVKNNRNEPVVLFLRMEKDQNQWKITDVVVEGISLVVTARGLFNDDINKKGMDGFIQSLIEQNRKETSQ